MVGSSQAHPNAAVPGEADENGSGLGGAHQVLNAFTGGGPGAERGAEAPLGQSEGGHAEQAGGGHDDAQGAGIGVVPTEEVPAGFDGPVGGEYIQIIRGRAATGSRAG